jgi:multiple sugar transport system permease protein
MPSDTTEAAVQQPGRAALGARTRVPRGGWSPNGGRLGVLFLLPTLAFLVVLVAYPVAYNVYLSFQDYNYLLGVSRFVGLQHYVQLLHDPVFWRSLGNNLVWTLGGVGGQLLLGFAAALLLDGPGRGMALARTLLLIPYVVPAIATAITWRWMFNDFYGILSFLLAVVGLLPAQTSPFASLELAMPAAICVGIWRGFPFAMIVYWATLQGIPTEEYEAARVDGAGALQEFWSITLPHLKHITLVLVVLRTLWMFNYFDLLYLLTKGGPAGATQHLPILVYITSFGLFRFGEAAAIAGLMAVTAGLIIALYVKVQGPKEL